MWLSGSYTNKGKVRQLNEDAVLDLAAQDLWLVADGMGGHANGDFASQLVTSTLQGYVSSRYAGICKSRLIDALSKCNSQLVEKAIRDQVGIIGCTVALVQARARSILCSWSGDSRIYRLRNKQLSLLSRDHSQQSMVEDRDILCHPISPWDASQMLTGAIGGDGQLALEHCWFELCPGDIFLLCTDGLNKEVSDEEIHATLSTASGAKQALNSLAGLYQDRGARDNVGMVWASYDSA